MKVRAVAASLVLMLVATGCLSGAKAAGVLRADTPSGAQVKTAEGWQPLKDGRAIEGGQEVRTGSKGSVTLASERVSFELGPASQIRVLSVEHVIALGGELLAQAGAEPVLVATENGDEITGSRTTFRLTYGERVAAYRGAVTVTIAGEAVHVGVARELQLGLASTVVRALSPDPADVWDRRLMNDAIQIDRQLEPYRRTFDVNVGAGPATIDFLATYVQRDFIEFARYWIPQLRSSKFDVLIVALIALERAGQQNTSVRDAWSEVVGLRSAGASHGVVAQALGVTADGLTKRLLRALAGGKPQAPEVNPTPKGRPQPTASGRPTSTGQPTPAPTRSSTPTPDPTPTETEEPSPSPSPSPSPTSSCLIIDQVQGKC